MSADKTKLLGDYVERRFQKWLTEQPLDTVPKALQATGVDDALAEITADGITDVAELRDFDLEGIWER